MKIVMHYGVLVNSEAPVGGVISNNGICQFISDCEPNAIDLDWEYHLTQCENEEHDNCYESDCPTLLIGGWKKNADGKYEENKETEFSAIVGEIYTQVIWSKHTKRCALCSPCYAGQGDLDAAGEFLTFDLPPDARDEDVSRGTSGEKSNG